MIYFRKTFATVTVSDLKSSHLKLQRSLRNADLLVRTSGRLKIAQRFIAGIGSAGDEVREADG
jgi:hypothetical protein